jgi:ABC-type polysaccharide/polyol phosphate transport system ATPase subunit
MSSDPATNALVVRSVTKTFRVPREAVLTLKERAMHPFRRVRSDEFVALRDVSFEVEQGEFFGIVGRNGSGKSTLLKCLAGIYGIDDGEMSVRGRMSTFIELGVGFNQDLAARDNIIMNAIMLGLTPSQARELVDPVLDFAELHEFSELKLKNYSSGMNVRLAFSVMLQAKADIMLIDEVLAVGDANFQEKCFAEFKRMREEGRTVLFVTHDMGSVERFCDRAMLLEKGDLVKIGDPAEVAELYVDMNFRRKEEKTEDDAEHATVSTRDEDGAVRFVFAAAEHENGVEIPAVLAGETCRIRARIQALEEVSAPMVILELFNEHEQKVLVIPCPTPPGIADPLQPGDVVDYIVRFPCIIAPGPYLLKGKVSRGDSGLDVIHRNDSIARFAVYNTTATGGIVDLDIDREVNYVERAQTDVRAPAPDAGEPDRALGPF